VHAAPTVPPVRRLARTAAALASCALLAGAAGCSSSVSGDGIPSVNGPHRVPVAGQPGGYRWVALGKDWTKLAQVDPSDIGTTADAIGTDGSRVFVVRVDLPSATALEYPPGQVTAYDGAHGTRLWATSVQWAPDTVPVGADGVVVFVSGKGRPRDDAGGLAYVALDVATGEQRWRRPVSAPGLSVVDHRDDAAGVFLGGLFYYTDGDTVYGVDARTGAVRHRRRIPDVRILSGPAVTGGRLAVVTEPTYDNRTTDREQLHLFGADLRPSSTYTYPDTTDAPNCAQFLLSGADGILVSWSDRVLCGFAQRAGRLRLLWSVPLSSQTPSAPVGGVVPLLDFSDEPDNTVVGIDARTGQKLWTNTPPEDFDARARIAVVDGTLFSLGHHVQILDPRTGRTTFDARPTFHGENRGGDDLPVFASGHIVMLRAEGVWAFD
jgi:outer membrane protein assembly factor BamB